MADPVAAEALLAAEKTQLAEKEARLRDDIAKKEADIGGLEDDLLKSRKSQTVDGTVSQNNKKPLSACKTRFNAAGAWHTPDVFTFAFVMHDAFGTVLKMLEDVCLTFFSESVDNRVQGLEGAYFEYPIVVGASGSGESRVCWEAGGALKAPGGARAIRLFINCSTAEYGDASAENERDALSYIILLARVLLERLLPMADANAYDGSLPEVLKRIRTDANARVVFLQIDEYSDNPVLARMFLRACRDVFHALGATFGME